MRGDPEAGGGGVGCGHDVKPAGGTDYARYLLIDDLLDLQRPLTPGAHDEAAVHHRASGLRAVVQADPARARQLAERELRDGRARRRSAPLQARRRHQPRARGAAARARDDGARGLHGVPGPARAGLRIPVAPVPRDRGRRPGRLWEAFCTCAELPEDRDGASRRSPTCTATTSATPRQSTLHVVAELMLDFDEAIARWRHHHVLMAAREIGSRPGTGGSTASSTCAPRSTSASSASCGTSAPRSDVLTAAGIARRHGVQDVLRDVTLAIGPRRPHRRRRPERDRQVDAAADPRRRSRRPTTGASSGGRPRSTVGYLPAGARRRPGRDAARVPAPPHRCGRGRAPRSTGPPRRWPPTRRRRRLHRRARALPGARRRRPRGPGGAVVRRGRPRRRAARPADGDALGRQGRPGRARRDAARRRFDVLLLDEPTNNLDFAGLDALERFVARRPTPRWSSSRTTAPSSIAAATRIVEHRARHAGPRAVYHGGWRPTSRRAALALRARAQRLRGLRRTSATGCARPPAHPQLVRVGRQACQEDFGQGQARRRGAAEGAQNLAGKAGGAARRLERLERTGRSRSRSSPGSCGCGCAPPGRGGDVVARLVDAVIERGELGASGPSTFEIGWQRARRRPRPQRLGQDLAAARRARRASRWPPARAGSVPAQWSASSTSRAARSTPTTPLLEVFRGAPGMGEPRRARCWPSSGSSADHVDRPAPTLSPGERTRALLALLAGTRRQPASSSTSPPTTSTSRPSSSSRRRSPSSTAP